MYSHLWTAVQQGKITCADIEAELNDIDAHHTGTKIEEAHVLDLIDARAYTRAKEETMQKKTGQGMRIDEAGCMIFSGEPGRGKINLRSVLVTQADLLNAQLLLVDPKSPGADPAKGCDDES